MEILLMILEYAIGETWYLTSNLWDGASSAWCRSQRMKKALPLVCKTWHSAGTQFLYKEVVLRNSGQVPALERTLKSSTTAIGHLIQSLTLTCPVEAPWDSIFAEAMPSIIHHTPKLRTLSLKPSISLPSTCHPLQIALANISSSITSLHYVFQDEQSNYVDLRFLLNSCRSLTYLNLSAFDMTNTLSKQYDAGLVAFPRLENINLDTLRHLRLGLGL